MSLRISNWNIWIIFDYFTNLFGRGSVGAVVMLMVMLLIAACLFILSDSENKKNRKKQLGMVGIVGIIAFISFALIFLRWIPGTSTSSAGTAETAMNTENSTGNVQSEETEPEEDRQELILALPWDTYIPYIYWDDNEDLAGVDYAIAQEIAEYLDMELRVEHMEFDEILLYVQNAAEEGKFCIGMGGLEETESGSQMVDYSDVYAQDAIVGVTRDEDTGDLFSENSRIGTQGDTTASMVVESESRDNCSTFRDQGALMKALQTGCIDAALTDSDTTIIAEELGMMVTSQFLEVDHRIAVVKDEEYLGCINDALAHLEGSGKIAEILEMYNYKVARAEIPATEYSTEYE